MHSVKDQLRPVLQAISSNPLVRVPMRGLARAGILPPAVWNRMPVDQTFEVLLPDGSSFLYSSVRSDRIARALYWGDLRAYLTGKGGEHYIEPETLLIFFKLAQKAKFILDVGANTGIFSMLACAANPNAQVLSFEPVPDVYARVAKNIEINGWQNRCEVRNEAVSDKVGTAQFHVPFGTSLPVSGSLNVNGYQGQAGRLIEVPVTTLDKACERETPLDLAKLDVEGFENQVLEGAQNLLAKSQPTLIVECNPGGTSDAVEAILRRFDYQFYHLTDRGPVKVEHLTPDATQHYRNYLCTTKANILEMIA